MTQNILWSTMFAAQGGLYGGGRPFEVEAGTAPHYLGKRMGARSYYTRPTQMFTSSTAYDVKSHNRGVRMCTSVSNQVNAISGFTWDKGTNGVSTGVGSWDSDWTDLFTRMTSYLNFGAAVDSTGVGSYGGLTYPDVELIIDHEVDQPKYNTYGTTAQYAAYVRHVHNLMVTAGVRDKFTLNFCVTEYGISNGRLGTINAYYPGADVIDVLGIDFYGDFNGSWAYDGATKPFSSAFANALAWVRSLNKPFNCPEFQEAESGSDSDMQAWYEGVATTLNAATDVVCTAIYLWCQASNKYQNYNYLASDDPATSTAHVGKHTGIANAMAATGNNAVYTGSGVTTVAPAPTGLHVISLGSDGTTAEIGWDAAPAGYSINGARVYLGSGTTTNLARKDAAAGAADQPSSTVSWTFTGLNVNSTYTYSATWDNPVGNSGFGTVSGALPTFTTLQPGVTGSPNITTPPSVTMNATDNLKWDFSVGATDPNGEALSYAWVFTDPNGNTFTYTGVSGTTAEFNVAGNWSYSVAVTNTSLKTTTAVGTFAVTLGASKSTKYFNWTKPQTGDLVRTLGPLLRGFMDDLDLRFRNQVYRKRGNRWNNGLVAASFENESGHSTNTQTLSSGWAYWVAMILEDDTFDEIWLNFKTAQTGSGSQLAVYDSHGLILPNGVYTTGVDSVFTGAVNGPSKFSLSANGYQPETQRTPGERVYVMVYNTGASVAATIRVSSAPGTFALVGALGGGGSTVAAGAQPSFGGYNAGAGGLPTTLPFSSWTNQQQIWAALGNSALNYYNS